MIMMSLKQRPTNPISFMSIKVSVHGRVARPYLRAIEEISSAISPLKFFASIFLNWSVLKQLEDEGCLLYDCLGKKTFMRAMKMVARGPDEEWVRRTRELPRDEIVTHARASEFFAEFPQVSVSVDHRWWRDRLKLIDKFADIIGTEMETASRLCVRGRFITQVYGFILLQIRRNGNLQPLGERQVKNLAGRLLRALCNFADLPEDIVPDEAPTGTAEAINQIYEGLLEMLQEVQVVAEDLPEQGEDERDISLLKRILTDKKYQFMFLRPQQEMSNAFENARLPLRRIYSLVDENPDIFDDELEKEVRTFLKEQLPPDQQEVMVSSLSDGLLSLDGVKDVFRNLAVEDELNDAELNDVSCAESNG